MIVSLVIVFAFALGGLVHSAAGFGSALVAVPILGLIMPIRTAAPVEAILAFAISITVLYQNRRGLRWHETWPLLVGGLLGVPLGTVALKTLPSSLILGALGLLLLVYGAVELRRTRTLADQAAPRPRPRGRLLSLMPWLVGFCSGVLGGAYTTSGPPLILYGAYRRWPKATFKAVLQTCFLVMGVATVLAHTVAGLVTREVLRYALIGAPGLLVGILLGLRLDRRLDPARFRRLVLGLITLLGLALVARPFLTSH